MTYLNDTLLKAGIKYLIAEAQDSFIDTMTLYLKKFPEMIEPLFEGLLPINKEITEQMEEKIKLTLPSPDYFNKIIKVAVDIDYSYNQIYSVTYAAKKFYTKDFSKSQGVPSEEFPIEKIVELVKVFYPKDLIIN